MRLRSLLFVPGDRPERMEKALSSGADALILDLEDSVALAAKDSARQATAAFVRSARGEATLFVRVNPLASGLVEEDLAAIADCAPAGLVLPKAEGAASIRSLAGMAPGLPILPVATETPSAIFALGSYPEVSPLLAGLTWGAEDLPAAIGASSAREEDGSFTPPYELARSLTLFAAHSAAVPAIETVYPAFRDLDGLARFVARAGRDGFTGMMAIHPTQVPIINDRLTPTEDEVSRAREIIAAFDANPAAGVVQIAGCMIDAPHLKQARTIMLRAGVAP